MAAQPGGSLLRLVLASAEEEELVELLPLNLPFACGMIEVECLGGLYHHEAVFGNRLLPHVAVVGVAPLHVVLLGSFFQ